jgi:hypothetical protein
MKGKRSTSSRRDVLKGTVAAAVTPFASACLGSSDTSKTVESTFEEGKEGWSVVDMQTYGQHSDPDWSETIQTLEFVHESSGGVDGSGHIKHVDDTGGKAFFFSASDAFLGDMSEFVGGRLEFFLKTSPNDWQQDTAVVFQSENTVIATGFEQPTAEWTEYSIPLTTDSRSFYESNLSGSEIEQSTLENVLGDLQALRINGEYSSEVQEEVALDEVRLIAE